MFNHIYYKLYDKKSKYFVDHMLEIIEYVTHITCLDFKIRLYSFKYSIAYIEGIIWPKKIFQTICFYKVVDI